MSTEVVVVGAGVVGLSAAIAIKSRNSNNNVVVYESGSLDAISYSRQFILSYLSFDFLQHVGVKIKALPISKAIVSLESYWRRARFTAGDSDFYPLGYSIAEGELHTALIETAKSMKITIKENEQIDTVQNISTGVTVVADGKMNLMKTVGAEYDIKEHCSIASVSLTLPTSRSELLFHMFRKGSLAIVPTNQPSYFKAIIVGDVDDSQYSRLIKDALRSIEFTIDGSIQGKIPHYTLSQAPSETVLAIGNSFASLPPYAGIGLNLALSDCRWLLNNLDTTGCQLHQQYYQNRRSVRSGAFRFLDSIAKDSSFIKKIGIFLSASTTIKKLLTSMYDLR